MNQILHPLSLLAALAGSLILSLFLYLSAQRGRSAERRRHEAAMLRHESERKEMAESIVSLKGSLDRLRLTLEDERGPTASVPTFSVISGLSMNLNKRSQALRLYRRGETPEHIAAALQLPRGEVDLLLKVQKVLVPEPSGAAPRS